MEKWSKFLSDTRFSDHYGRNKPENMPSLPSFARAQFRVEQERDHDRVLFSTPFRRMGDKTQVFPLESIESIRTRLTHSYEVSNLARSLGIEIATTMNDKLPENAIRVIPASLAAVGLAHDIGNPPFGHQGEYAIRAWFKRNSNDLFSADTIPETKHKDAVAADLEKLTVQHKNDFLEFEGNAQTLRVLTKLQVISDDLGLNLTFGTLAAVMKYVASSDKISNKNHAFEKVGFFASEQSLVKVIRDAVGLDGDSRHPLALVMEACDDIAYSVLDAEDAIKKGIASLNDLLATLDADTTGDSSEKDEVVAHLCEKMQWELKHLRTQKLPPSELQDVATQKFRVYAIHLMVSAVAEAFKDNYGAIVCGLFDKELIKESKAAKLCKVLKTFDRENAFSHKTVLEVELNGYNTLNRLMDFLWIGISDRKCYDELGSKRNSPFAAYVYSRISKNYRRIFEGKVNCFHKDDELPIRYKEMQLLTDMVSGMTDQFCIDLHDDLLKHFREEKTVNGTSA